MAWGPLFINSGNAGMLCCIKVFLVLKSRLLLTLRNSRKWDLSSEGPSIVLMRTKKFAVNGDYLLPFSGIVGPLFGLMRTWFVLCLLSYQLVFCIAFLCLLYFVLLFWQLVSYKDLSWSYQKKKKRSLLILLKKKYNLGNGDTCKLLFARRDYEIIWVEEDVWIFFDR